MPAERRHRFFRGTGLITLVRLQTDAGICRGSLRIVRSRDQRDAFLLSTAFSMLTVNDEPLDYENGMTVSDILKRKNYIFRMLAVWIDGEFVPRDQYATTEVADGADVKVIHMIAGG